MPSPKECSKEHYNKKPANVSMTHAGSIQCITGELNFESTILMPFLNIWQT